MLHAELQKDEEFQEADILWPDAEQVLELPHVYYFHVDTDDDGVCAGELRPPMKLQVQQNASSPIDIPGRKVGATGEKGTGATAGFSKLGASRAGSDGGDSVVIGSHVFVPPHVIVDRKAKRDKAMMMFAVPTGRARARKMLE